MDKESEFIDKYIELCREYKAIVTRDYEGDWYIEDVSNWDNSDFEEYERDLV